MKFDKYVKRDLICNLKAKVKNEAIEELLQILSVKKYINDIDYIKEMVLQKKELMSTGIGLGIGVPHVRLDGFKEPIIAIGISKNGIADYVALDNQVVKIIFMIIVNKGAHRQYIELLAHIATMLKDDEFRMNLIDSSKSEDVFKSICTKCK